MKISVCMMVKNEEALLPFAIASVQGLADEIIVVDTGSTDNTVDLARRSGCRVILGGDSHNEAQERNRALNLAQGDWAVILDADEQVQYVTGLRVAIENTQYDALNIQMHYMNGSVPYLKYQLMRVFKIGTHCYRYRVHTIPYPTGDVLVGESPQIIEHRPPADRSAAKLERVLMLCLMDVEENPGDYRPLYYLARQYFYIGAWQMCLDTVAKLNAATVGYNANDAAEACAFVAECYWNLGDRVNPFGAMRTSIRMQPYRREWRGRLAEMQLASGDAKGAIETIEEALDLPEPKGGYVNPVWYGAHVFDVAARCYWEAGRGQDGLPYAEQALRLNPTDPRLQENLKFFQAAEA